MPGAINTPSRTRSSASRVVVKVRSFAIIRVAAVSSTVYETLAPSCGYAPGRSLSVGVGR